MEEVNLLTRLKTRYLESKSPDDFYAFIYQLSRECLIVPFSISFEENEEFMTSLENGNADIESSRKSLVMQDDLIFAFTEETEIPEDYEYSLFYLDIYQLEKVIQESKGFLIDPYTRPLILDKDTFSSILTLVKNKVIDLGGS